MRISVIIPALNEADHISGSVLSVAAGSPHEIIVADGGSRDGTPDIARRLGARVVRSERGRARQQNAGAAVASGDVLLFLHADTSLPEGWPGPVRRALTAPGVVAAAFSLGLAGAAFRFRIIEWGAALRTWATGIPYGDQAIFLRRETFERVGGFPSLPLLEDIEICRRLKRLGRVAVVPERVSSSARRFRAEGSLRAVLRNWVLALRYHLGADPGRLRRHYPDHAQTR